LDVLHDGVYSCDAEDDQTGRYIKVNTLDIIKAIAAAESGKEEGCSTSLKAAAKNILFKRKHGVPIEDVDFEWLENATGENNA